jgi:mannose-6-phosphate isomerase-like protein (cupin superfamily)
MQLNPPTEVATLGRHQAAAGSTRSQMEETMPDTVTRPSQPASGHKVAHARISEPVLVKGRREFFEYRDLGVADASAGTMRAQVMTSSQGMSRPTGWHYHECDGQFVYILKGWVDLEFEDGRTIRINEGDSLFIPGYLRHNEIRTSETMEILEVSVPGKMGTTPCEPPAGWKAQG